MNRRAFLTTVTAAAQPLAGPSYFPVPDSAGGWRKLTSSNEIRRVARFDSAGLDECFSFVERTTQHGGLLVARHGWLVYERYFGLGHRNARPNGASTGKSYTSIAVGILLNERPDLFPDGLDQLIFTPKYFPAAMFPLSDERKARIRLGQLLAMTAGIRGNNPGVQRGRDVTLDPAGPDGWQAMVDEMAFGKMDGKLNTTTLWCEPGEGYSYATSSAHLASVMLRHITGRELVDYLREKIAAPLGWGEWGWGYRNRIRDHTPGGGGIAVRPTDALRFAYLLLHDGTWKGRQLVPSEYVRRCRRTSPYNPHTDYSLQFDVNANRRWPGIPRDAFWKTGSGGFCFFVVPSLDLIVYKLGGRSGQYSREDTGFSHPWRRGGARDNWKESGIPAEETYRGTIRRIIQAIV